MLLAGVSALSVSAETYIVDGDLKFTRNAAGITIHEYLGEAPELTLPATLVGRPVVAVNEYAFMNNTMLESVSMPISITNVDRGVFYGCTSLVSAELPKNCTTVGQYLFYGCSSLKNVVLPDVLMEVPRYCFSWCSSLEEVFLPSTAKVIGDFAFANCSELTDVYVSRYTTSISENAFNNSPKVVIHGYLNTYAHEYAMENGIPFSLIDEPAETFYVTFLNYDGSVFWTSPVSRGGSVKYPVEIPTKPSTDTHYYEFSHWSGNIVNVQENEFLNPVFKEFRIKGEDELDNYSYSVVFLDGDGAFMEMQTVKEKEAATAPEVIPAKTPTAQYYYTFTGWDTDFSDVRENMVVRPLFEEHLREYTVTFKGMDGEIIDEQVVSYGEAATAPEAPEVENYLFTGWDTEYGFITSDLTVKALYEEIPLPPEPEAVYYSVVFLGFDGIYISHEVVKEGESATEPQVPAVEGFSFIGWNVDFSSVTSDLVVRALFKKLPASEDEPIPEEKSYVVAFVDYDGRYLSSQIVKEGQSAIEPEEPTRAGYTFVGWDTYIGSVYSDMTAKAVYAKLPVPPDSQPKTGSLKIEIAGGTGFSISIDGGFAKPQGTTYRNSSVPVGVEVMVVSGSVSGEDFIGWINPVTGVIVSDQPSFYFVTSGNDSYTAVYKTPLWNFSMVMFKNDKASGGNGRILDMQYYSTMDEICFPEDPTQVGFDFAGWNMTQEEIIAAIAAGQNVTVLAKWTKAIVPVQVTVVGGSGSGTYNANNRVTAVADSAPEGEKFAYWADSDGNIKSYSEVYNFYPSADTTIYAVYMAEEDYIDYQVLVSVDSIDTESVADKNVFTYSWYCPDGYEFVKAGIVAVNKDNLVEETFVAGSADPNVYDRSPSGDNLVPVNTYTWTKSNVQTGQTWVAKAYVQYKDVYGSIVTVYSEPVEAVKL